MLKFLKLNQPLAALFLLCLCGLSQAQELRWYDVEVVVFAHARGEYINSETWPAEWPAVDTDQAIDFDSVKHRLFNRSQSPNKLVGVIKRIEKSSAINCLPLKPGVKRGLKRAKAYRYSYALKTDYAAKYPTEWINTATRLARSLMFHS